MKNKKYIRNKINLEEKRNVISLPEKNFQLT